MTALPQSSAQAQPQRRCIVSGRTLPTERLVRFVVGPTRDVVPDIRNKLGGRGIWVCADRVTLETAINQNLFKRAARANVSIPTGLAQNVESQLVARVKSHLSFARKAGQAVAGFEKVSASIKSGHCALLMMAHDAADNASKKLPSPETPMDALDCLTGNELGEVFGRDRTVQVAVADGGLVTQIKIDGRRLAEFRGKPSLDEVRHDAEV